MTRTKAAFLLLGIFAVLAILSHLHFPPTTTTPASSGNMPSDLVGKTFTCGNGFIAGVSADDVDRIRDLIKEDDRRAIATMVLQGRAFVIKKGTRATIEDVDVFRALERFHVRGLPASLYTNYGMIE